MCAYTYLLHVCIYILTTCVHVPQGSYMHPACACTYLLQVRISLAECRQNVFSYYRMCSLTRQYLVEEVEEVRNGLAC